MLLSDVMGLAGDWDGAVAQLITARDMYAQTALLGGTKIFLDPSELADCIARLGVAYSNAKERDRAFDCFSQAEKICMAAEDVQGLAKHQCRCVCVYVRVCVCV